MVQTKVKPKFSTCSTYSGAPSFDGAQIAVLVQTSGNSCHVKQRTMLILGCAIAVAVLALALVAALVMNRLHTKQKDREASRRRQGKDEYRNLVDAI